MAQIQFPGYDSNVGAREIPPVFSKSSPTSEASAWAVMRVMASGASRFVGPLADRSGLLIRVVENGRRADVASRVPVPTR